MSAHLRLLLVEDEPDHVLLFKQSLKAVEWLSFDIAHAPDAQRAMKLGENQLIDAYFVDYCLGGDTGVSLVQMLRARGDRRPVVLLTSRGDEYLVVDAMRSGADDYISKDDLLSPRFATVLERVVDRSTALLRNDRVMAEMWRRLESLTPREREVMELMVEGKTTHEIACTLSRSDNTIKIHRSHVLRKMQAHTPAELTHMVLQSRSGELQMQL